MQQGVFLQRNQTPTISQFLHCKIKRLVGSNRSGFLQGERKRERKDSQGKYF